MLRMTLHETVTYTTYTTNRRAGRIVFVPNNFIFSSMISNYSHGGMKTVWDGLDITISFESNHKKALFIAKEVATQLSKGYTSIARKQLNLLRREYNLKTTQVDPQCFTLLESYGMRISIWYQTNSYATLVLRSTLSSAILERYQQEDDIVIAYKTQDINLKEAPITIDENV
jgi:small-conductance mechanosensitive channel